MPRSFGMITHGDGTIEVRLLDGQEETSEPLRSVKVGIDGSIQILEYDDSHDPAPCCTIAIGPYTDNSVLDLMIDGPVNFTDNP